MINRSLSKILGSLRSRNAGTPPGTLASPQPGGEVIKPIITVIDYNENSIKEQTISALAELNSYRTPSSVSWINVSSISDTGTLQEIGKIFGLHSLVLEDIANTGGRPKIEELEKMLFSRLNMIYIKDNSEEIITEQVSLILGEGFVLTFQEQEGDVFDNIRDRLRSAKGRIRKKGSDYLFYSIIDAIVDNYFFLPEALGETLEGMEEKILKKPEPLDLQIIHRIKSDLLLLRRSIWPLREIVNSILRGEFSLIKDENQIFIRDLYDHIVQVVDTLETFRDITAGMVDTYMTSVSNKIIKNRIQAIADENPILKKANALR